MTFTDFSKLRNLIEGMGIDRDERAVLRRKQLWNGELISGRDELIVGRTGLFDILPNGDVVRVLVHVPQGPYSGGALCLEERMESPSEGWHKVHVLWCGTVDQWRSRLRKTLRDDGKFLYPLFWSSGDEYKPELRDGGRPLLLCQNCARSLRKLGFPARAENFGFRDFLEMQHLSQGLAGLQFESDYDRIPNVYSKEWPEISLKFKSGRFWRCERCHRDLSNHRKFLHAHHRDANKNNNSVFNLEALCIRCHAKEHPFDGRLNGSPDLLEYNKIYPKK